MANVLTAKHMKSLADIYNRHKERITPFAPYTMRGPLEELYRELETFLVFNGQNFDSARFYRETHD